MQKINVFDWKKEFSEIFKNGGFDCVIGNPPYIRSRDLSKDYNSYMTQIYNLTNSGFDYATLFIEKATNILNNYGLLGFITTNKYFSSRYGLKIRKYLIESNLLKFVVNFGSGVFNDTPIETSIIILNKGQLHKEILYNNYKKIKNKNIDIITDKKIKTSFFKTENNLMFFPNTNSESLILSKLNNINTSIKDFYSFSAGKGITEIKKDLISNKVSNSMPVYSGKEIWRYINKPNVYYIDERRIKSYETDTHALIRELSTTNRATIIKGNCKIGLLNSVTIINAKNDTPDIKDFVCVFNSSLFNKIYCLFYESTRTHANLRYKEIYIKDLPFPEINNDIHTRLVSLVDSMLETQKEYHNAKNDNDKKLFKQKIDIIDSQIDGLVYELYGLNEDDIKVIEAGL